MAVTDSSVITAPVNVVFQMTLLRNAKSRCPYFAGTTPASISEHNGSFTAKWRRIENLSVPSAALTELTGVPAFPTRTAAQPTITDVTATVAKFGNFIYLTEECDLVNYSGAVDKLSEVLGINAGQAINRQIRNTMEDNATAILSGATVTTATSIASGATASSFLKESDIANANNTLMRNDAMQFTPQTTGSQNINTTPIRPAFVGFNHVDTTEDVRTLSGFIDVSRYAGQIATWNGEYGMVGGVRFIETTESTIDTGTGVTATGTTATTDGRTATGIRTDVYNTVIMGQDSIGSLSLGVENVKSVYMAGDDLPAVQMIAHGRGSGGVADPLNELSSMGWKSWQASTVLNSGWIRVVRHSVRRLAQGQ